MAYKAGVETATEKWVGPEIFFVPCIVCHLGESGGMSLQEIFGFWGPLEAT